MTFEKCMETLRVCIYHLKACIIIRKKKEYVYICKEVKQGGTFFSLIFTCNLEVLKNLNWKEKWNSSMYVKRKLTFISDLISIVDNLKDLKEMMKKILDINKHV